ncbi:MAG TPA: U32 family peptidase C-terminal domain-containing protein [Candidatus Bipolaricaulota bacterium]|nr:U32 family peptidase C-terminal domain-containing protein [Candidatus Bipolaricaulota bacterium]
MNDFIKSELLAPAGNLEKLKTAFAFGADAVYCGIPDFSLRVRINQFDLECLKDGIEYAHDLGKKVFITVNIFAHNFHLPELEKYLLELKKIKPDALIVSDPGVLTLIKEIWPEAEIHLSTQANCTNWRAAKFWFDQGVKRIILAREVTLDQIKEIHEKVPEVELEAFVHGAMCVSYSGRCLLSKYFMNQSANLGDCTQPCRWEYKIKNKISKIKKMDDILMEGKSPAESLPFRSLENKRSDFYIEEVKRPGEFLEITEDEHGTYILNSKDLCLIEYLKDLAKAGVSSFKIEGRAKSVYYAATATKAYRQAIDSINEKDFKNIAARLKEELKKNINRGFTTGFLFGKENVEQRYESGHEGCDYEFVGMVTNTKNDEITNNYKYAEVKVHNVIKIGDEVELVAPKGENFSMTIKEMFDSKTKEPLTEAHGGQGLSVLIGLDRPAPEFTVLRKLNIQDYEI